MNFVLGVLKFVITTKPAVKLMFNYLEPEHGEEGGWGHTLVWVLELTFKTTFSTTMKLVL